MSDDPSAPPAERRGDVRRTALKGAHIVCKDGTVIDCRIRNISEGGARLELAAPQLLPHTFELQIADLPGRMCNLRWAKGNLIGVQFQD